LRDHEGNVTGSIGIIRDITKRKQAEEAMKGSELQLREKNAALRAARTQLSVLNKSLEERVATRTAEVEHLLKQKDEFVAQLGHDLKTPLTPLVGLLPLVKNREQDPQLKEMLGVAIDNVQYMRDLIVKTLELARLNTPGIEFALHKTNLLEQVMRVVDSRKMIIDEKDITVRSEIDEGIAVKADKLRLQEVIDNLIANAVKYTPSGGSVTLDAKRHDGVVTVSVSDTGIGMTQDQLELAFEPFYKADQSRHDLHSSGLGLSICKRIVEKHGGLIWAESPGEGKGSTLHFTIPQA
jgi:signal transduction histidine kinase